MTGWNRSLPDHGAGFAEDGEEGVGIQIVVKGRLAPVAAIHEVVDGSGKLYAQWPWHRPGSTANTPAVANYENRLPVNPRSADHENCSRFNYSPALIATDRPPKIPEAASSLSSC